MIHLLDVIRLEETIEILLLVILLIFIGGQMTQRESEVFRKARRFSAAVFLLYAVIGVFVLSPSGMTEILIIVLRASLAAGLGFGLALILFAPVAYLIEQARTFISKRTPKPLAIPNPPPLPPIQYMIPVVDERERQQQLEEQKLAEAQRLSAEQRREEARLRSDLLYERHARQLAASFPRERFVQFVERYMGERTAPDLVEQRELLLKEMILDSLGTATAPKFPTMTELATFFEVRRQEINQLPHDEYIKDTYRTQLNKQEDEALRRFLKP